MDRDRSWRVRDPTQLQHVIHVTLWTDSRSCFGMALLFDLKHSTSSHRVV